MKKIAILLCTSLGFLCTVHAQDVMIRKDGSEVLAKILEINPNEVSYKRFDNQDGPVYWEKKKDILKIKYANGTEDIFVQVLQQDEPVKKFRYSGLVELIPYFGDYSGGADGYGGVAINTSYGIQLKEKYFLGIGTGMNFTGYHTYTPLYATFGMDLSPDKIHPFFSVSLGAQFRINDDDYYYDDNTPPSIALWSNAMFGYRFKSFYTACGISVQTGYNREYNYNEPDKYNSFGAVCFMMAFGFKW